MIFLIFLLSNAGAKLHGESSKLQDTIQARPIQRPFVRALWFFNPQFHLKGPARARPAQTSMTRHLDICYVTLNPQPKEITGLISPDLRNEPKAHHGPGPSR